ncbi:protease inhibitor I42 family protein [Clostridium ganghwense]|uniref:Protease inhibitor I42 family protein n=1 Tax=Clostridium ganghwense TaxID=312089 RepID=A0ABT4CNT2_9CLOT|nr:protease inhibitor I42 family protein [Clostridium ganghwense]MCY6370717.1 protease inhibitor I42 family protein [Clostridium ganghwense]
MKQILLSDSFTNKVRQCEDCAWFILDYVPTTPYKWVYVPDNSGVYKLHDKITLIPQPIGGIVGVGGKIIWKFIGCKVGSGSVCFNLVNITTNQTVKTIVVDIKVVNN